MKRFNQVGSVAMALVLAASLGVGCAKKGPSPEELAAQRADQAAARAEAAATRASQAADRAEAAAAKAEAIFQKHMRK